MSHGIKKFIRFINFASLKVNKTFESDLEKKKPGQGGEPDNLISAVSQCTSAARPADTWRFILVATH